MMPKRSSRRSSERPITSADVARYLKGLATLHQNPRLGSPAMAAALIEISEVLAKERFKKADDVLETHLQQEHFEFETEVDFSVLSLDQVTDILARKDMSKSELVIIGTDRFGIPKSRLERSTRDDVIDVISAAVAHEKSLSILSQEARQRRSS